MVVLDTFRAEAYRNHSDELAESLSWPARQQIRPEYCDSASQTRKDEQEIPWQTYLSFPGHVYGALPAAKREAAALMDTLLAVSE